MREFIGVKSPFEISIDTVYRKAPPFSFLKREALMFSRVAIPYINSNLAEWRKHTNTLSSLSDSIQWLVEKGIVFEPEIEHDEDLMPDEEYRTISKFENILTNVASKTANDYISAKGVDVTTTDLEMLKGELKEALSVVAPFVFAGHFMARRTAILLNKKHQINACPVFSVKVPPLPVIKQNKSDIVQISLNALPVPDESTSWEQIIEYRNDPDSQNKFLDLRHWMSEVARGELTPIEVEEKLEYLISQYQRHMKLHRMKANQGVLQTIVVSPAEFAENLIKFRWGQIAQNLFSIKQRKIALMEGELTSPGNEVAYIVKARETFS